MTGDMIQDARMIQDFTGEIPEDSILALSKEFKNTYGCDYTELLN